MELEKENIHLRHELRKSKAAQIEANKNLMDETKAHIKTFERMEVYMDELKRALDLNFKTISDYEKRLKVTYYNAFTTGVAAAIIVLSIVSLISDFLNELV